MYAEDVSGSGRRKINQGFLMLVALDAREQPFRLLAVAAADAEERTLHLYQDTCLTTTLPPRMPHHYTCHYTGASAAGRGARTARAARPNPHPTPQAQPAQELSRARVGAAAARLSQGGL